MEEEKEWAEGGGSGREAGQDQANVEEQVDKLLVYKNILELLKPGETVTKVRCPFNYNALMSSYTCTCIKGCNCESPLQLWCSNELSYQRDSMYVVVRVTSICCSNELCYLRDIMCVCTYMYCTGCPQTGWRENHFSQ